MYNDIRVKFEHYVNTLCTISWRHDTFDHYVNEYGHFCIMTFMLNLNIMSTLSVLFHGGMLHLNIMSTILILFHGDMLNLIIILTIFMLISTAHLNSTEIMNVLVAHK